MNGDQYFQPGDKVMKVCGARELGISVRSERPVPCGIVFCVSEFCDRSPLHNGVRLVGVENSLNDFGDKKWFPAGCFRKVAEIKLCIAAVEHINKSTPVPVETP